MQRFLFIFQIILKCGLIFLISYIWLRYFLSNTLYSILLSIAFTIIVQWISIAIGKRKNAKTSLKIKEKEDAENMFLSLLTEENSLNFFLQLALSRHKLSSIQKDFVVIDNGESGKVALVPFIKLSPLLPDDIAQIIKKCGQYCPNKIIITCNEYEKSCNSFAKNFNQDIVLIDKFETYALLYKEYDFYPEITTQYKKPQKLSFKDLLASAFTRTKTKNYLFCAVVILISSYWVGMNLYYCITASVLLLFALISFINPKYNKKKEQSLI